MDIHMCICICVYIICYTYILCSQCKTYRGGGLYPLVKKIVDAGYQRAKKILVAPAPLIKFRLKNCVFKLLLLVCSLGPGRTAHCIRGFFPPKNLVKVKNLSGGSFNNRSISLIKNHTVDKSFGRKYVLIPYPLFSWIFVNPLVSRPALSGAFSSNDSA